MQQQAIRTRFQFTFGIMCCIWESVETSMTDYQAHILQEVPTSSVLVIDTIWLLLLFNNFEFLKNPFFD